MLGLLGNALPKPWLCDFSQDIRILKRIRCRQKLFHRGKHRGIVVDLTQDLTSNSSDLLGTSAAVIRLFNSFFPQLRATRELREPVGWPPLLVGGLWDFPVASISAVCCLRFPGTPSTTSFSTSFRMSGFVRFFQLLSSSAGTSSDRLNPCSKYSWVPANISTFVTLANENSRVVLCRLRLG